MTTELAREILDKCLALIDNITAEQARDSLYDHPACNDTATHGLEYHPATIRYDQHGCTTGHQCDACVQAARDRFAVVVGHFGYATCPMCGETFTDYAGFVSLLPTDTELPWFYRPPRLQLPVGESARRLALPWGVSAYTSVTFPRWFPGDPDPCSGMLWVAGPPDNGLTPSSEGPRREGEAWVRRMLRPDGDDRGGAR
ncbi:hypothetical protein [Nocardia puris]|uniref:Uncharacterized protein n=1 Tax=Nocardia puris TaxID=208602 RepID=A0A366DAK0_9NOCA|nr:hypothetical protein [Nocardia puris]RBO87053.1 hypothetical protein DFR74_112233 [Nocardia puris]